MEIRYYIVFSLLWSSLFATTGSSAELTISVKYPDGTPASGIKVQQVQLERVGHGSTLVGITDEKGQMRIRFEQEKSSYENRHGYGIYRYVVMPQDYTWQVSDLFYWNKDPYSEQVLQETGVWPAERYEKRMQQPKSNWSIGKFVKVLPGSRIKWEIALTKGRDVRALALDQFSEPLKDKKLSVSLDLEGLSHTGWGGGIPMFEIQTNGDGCFNLPNAGQFFYSIDLHDNKYCAPGVRHWTGVVRSKFDQGKGTVVYHRCKENNVTFVVTDKLTGRPLAHARIFQVKLFPSARQGGPFGYTDINGEYISRKFYNEHVVQFGVVREGYEPWIKDIKEFTPGATYTISLGPQEKPYQPGVCGFKCGGVKGEAED